MRVVLIAVLLGLNVRAMEVYLRELTVFTSHESSFLSDKPEVYFACEDDRLPVLLRDVEEVDKKYVFGPEQIPATHLKDGECVMCTLKEFDILSEDDVYGKMRLCAEGFKTGVSEVMANGEFHAKFVCPECKLPRERRAQANCEGSSASSAAETNRLSVHSSAQASSNSYVSSEEASKSKGDVSTGMVVFLCLVVFGIGVAVGVVSLKFCSQAGRQRESRIHELNPILDATNIPFEALPKGDSKSTTRLKPGVATYHQIASDEPDNAA